MSWKRRKINQHEIRNPDKILSNLLSDYVEGRLDDYKWLYRAVVLQIDTVGGQLETNPDNPVGSIKARIVSDGSDKYVSDEDLSIYWPLFPFSNLPIKEGEHVYVIFEDESREHGLWLTRIPEPKNVESKNITPGVNKFIHFSSNGRVNANNAETIVQDSDTTVNSINSSPEFTLEQVPDFKPRVGDYTLQGSNNTLINLGRDRISTTDTGLTDGAGTIDLVSGRTALDVDFANDKSRILISSNTQADTNFNIQAGQNVSQAATIVVKSNEIRILAREGCKIVNEGGEIVIQTPGDITIEGANINIGLGAQEKAVLGDTLKSLLEQLCDAIVAITVPTAMGPSGPPVNAAQVSAIRGQLLTALSQTVKVKQ